MNVKLMTIDGSTNKSGIAIFHNGKYEKRFLLDCSKDKVIDSRFESMSKWILETIDTYKPDIIYMEETYNAKNPQTTKFLTRLQGVVYGWCLNNKCEFNTIRPTQWRKQLSFVQGKGVKREQLKAQSIKYVLDNYGLNVTDDEADAICIGDAVLKIFRNYNKGKLGGKGNERSK